MSTNTNYLTSPKGDIQFLALNRKVAKAMTADSPEGYAVRIKFDGNTKEGAEWRKTIEAINPNLIGTKHIDKKGEFTVRAFSLYLPEVVDSQGNEVTELPNFYADSTGTATMVVQPYTGNAMGGAITLAGVVIHDIETSEAGTDRETSVADLRNLLKGLANTK